MSYPHKPGNCGQCEFFSKERTCRKAENLDLYIHPTCLMKIMVILLRDIATSVAVEYENEEEENEGEEEK